MREVLIGFGVVLLYFIVCASLALLLRLFTRVPTEVFRKLLHFILLGSLLVWTFAFSTWWLAALTAVIFSIAVFPVLALGERLKGYSEFLTERKSGELKNSLLLVFFMFAAVIAVCWGWLNDRLLALACIYAWGIGDAAAALIGKRFGKHSVKWKGLDGKKSAEGTVAMFTVSFLSVLTILLVRGGLAWYGYLVAALVTAAVSALVELYTRNGMDTVSCPLSAMAVLLPMVSFFGGLA